MRPILSFVILLSSLLAHAQSPKPTDVPLADFKTKKTEDWARQLPSLLPAIQKCVNDAAVPVAVVIKAWPMNHGMVGVRLHTNQSRQYVCVASHDGMRLDSVHPVSTHEALQEGNPVFHPSREQPPSIDCGRLEKIIVEHKLLAGWLQYDPCPLQSPKQR